MQNGSIGAVDLPKDAELAIALERGYRGVVGP